MKIIAILDNEIKVGGGFNQALNAVLQMQRLCHNKFEFEVFTTFAANLDVLCDLGVDAVLFEQSILDRILGRLAFCWVGRYFQSRKKLIHPLEALLIKHNCDLVYFVTQSRIPISLQKVNYITTLMDLCHRDQMEFPEVRNFAEFSDREHLFQSTLSAALIVITDSDELANTASSRYGIDRSRFLTMPYTPSPFINLIEQTDSQVVLKKYGLSEGYFFYPAQFWAHKNHIRILQALINLRNKNFFPRVVFSGGDHGNMEYITDFIFINGLSNQVNLLGFVNKEDMKGLYENAAAVIMPTYFGPTNLPPLEAWTIGKPLIYSAHLSGQAGEAALYVNPDDSEDVSNAMMAVLDSKIRARLIQAGKQRLTVINAYRNTAENELVRRLETFSLRRQCWK